MMWSFECECARMRDTTEFIVIIFLRKLVSNSVVITTRVSQDFTGENKIRAVAVAVDDDHWSCDYQRYIISL